MKKNMKKSKNKVIKSSIILLLLIVGVCFLFVPIFKNLNFGLDLQDVKSFSSIPYASPRFRAWYILQHLKSPKTGCKAFVDHMKFSELVKVEF